MPLCKRCSAEVEPDDRFCGNCGEKLEVRALSISEGAMMVEQAPPPPTPPPSPIEQVQKIYTAGEAMRSFDIVKHIQNLMSYGIPEFYGLDSQPFSKWRKKTISWNPKKYLEKVKHRVMYLGYSHAYFIETGEERLLTVQRKVVFTKTFHIKIRDRTPILFDDEQLLSLGNYFMAFKVPKDKYYGKLYYTRRRFIFDTEESEILWESSVWGEEPPEPGRPMYSFWIKPEFEELYRFIHVDGWEEGTTSKKKYRSIKLAVGEVKDGIMKMIWIMDGPSGVKSVPVPTFHNEKGLDLAKITPKNKIEDASHQIQGLIKQSTPTNILDIIRYNHACKMIPGAMGQMRTGPSTPATEIRYNYEI